MAKITIELNENMDRKFKIYVDLGMITGCHTYREASQKAKSMAADIIGPLGLTNYYANIDFQYCFSPQSAQTWLEERNLD